MSSTLALQCFLWGVTLGPKYLICGYLDPLGYMYVKLQHHVLCTSNIPHNDAGNDILGYVSPLLGALGRQVRSIIQGCWGAGKTGASQLFQRVQVPHI